MIELTTKKATKRFLKVYFGKTKELGDYKSHFISKDSEEFKRIIDILRNREE